MKVKEAVVPIAANLTDDQADVRKKAAAALGEIRDPVALPDLSLIVSVASFP